MLFARKCFSSMKHAKVSMDGFDGGENFSLNKILPFCLIISN